MTDDVEEDTGTMHGIGAALGISSTRLMMHEMLHRIELPAVQGVRNVTGICCGDTSDSDAGCCHVQAGGVWGT